MPPRSFGALASARESHPARGVGKVTSTQPIGAYTSLAGSVLREEAPMNAYSLLTSLLHPLRMMDKQPLWFDSHTCCPGRPRTSCGRIVSNRGSSTGAGTARSMQAGRLFPRAGFDPEPGRAWYGGATGTEVVSWSDGDGGDNSYDLPGIGACSRSSLARLP